jgi:hypothetical protein
MESTGGTTNAGGGGEEEDLSLNDGTLILRQENVK